MGSKMNALSFVRWTTAALLALAGSLTAAQNSGHSLAPASTVERSTMPAGERQDARGAFAEPSPAVQPSTRARDDGSGSDGTLTPLAAWDAGPRSDSGLSASGVVLAYTVLGVQHIFLGPDHLLFLLALILLVKEPRRLVLTVTAFTIGHSMTLVAATLGHLPIASTAVESAIALSVILIAAELLRMREGRPSVTQRFPWIVAFAFGLLHGLGFAGALAGIGLPDASIPLALASFNVGVEVGQLTFIGVVLAALFVARQIVERARCQVPGWAWRIVPYGIAGIGSIWFVERIVAM